MSTVRLYTRQHKNSLYELKKEGRIINHPLYIQLHMRDISDYFLDRYDIFVSMAEKIIPRPSDVHYPIWCSVSLKSCLKPTDNDLVYVLDVPEQEVLYFDGAKWDYVLNYLYIPKDQADKEAFACELKKKGIDSPFKIFMPKYKGHYPDIEKKIEDSWVRIFKIDHWNEYSVQANLWHIKKEWVKKIVFDAADLNEITSS